MVKYLFIVIATAIIIVSIGYFTLEQPANLPTGGPYLVNSPGSTFENSPALSAIVPKLTYSPKPSSTIKETPKQTDIHQLISSSPLPSIPAPSISTITTPYNSSQNATSAVIPSLTNS